MKWIIFVLFLLGVFNLNAQFLNPVEAKKDLVIFRDALNRYHPELYRYIDSVDFEKEFENVKLKIRDSITIIEFYNHLSGLSAKIKDGHLKIIPSGKDQNYPFFDYGLFPLKLYFEKNKTYAIGSFEELNVPKFFEILSINGVDIKEIKNKLMANLTFADGESLGGKYYQLNRFFAGYFSSQYGISSQYVIEGKTNEQFLNFKLSSTSKNKIDLHFNSEQSPLQLNLIDKKRAVLTIPRFYSLKGEMKFSKFLKASFNKLKNEGISKLIIDVRGNEGGNEKFGIELYRYIAKEPFRYYNYLSVKPNSTVDYKSNTSKLFLLANSFSRNRNGTYIFPFGGNNKIYKPHKNGFQGDVILLIDGQCFSVTSEFAAKVKSDRRATIIGSETAGGIKGNSSGFFTIINLPHSNFDIGIPRIGFNMFITKELLKSNRGIIPDEEIEVKAENKINGQDLIMLRALDY